MYRSYIKTMELISVYIWAYLGVCSWQVGRTGLAGQGGFYMCVYVCSALAVQSNEQMTHGVYGHHNPWWWFGNVVQCGAHWQHGYLPCAALLCRNCYVGG